PTARVLPPCPIHLRCRTCRPTGIIHGVGREREVLAPFVGCRATARTDVLRTGKGRVMRLRTALTLVWPVLSGTLGGCSDSGSADGESADGMAMSPAAGSASADSAASAGSAASDVG